MVIKDNTLNYYNKKMKWTDDPAVPMMQGAWIQQLIYAYPDIKVVAYGIDGTRIGLKDNKGNKAFWKCDGVTLTPLGTIPGKKERNIKKEKQSKS